MTLLAVLGMHRSGTSLVAGMLSHVGWDEGPPDDLMEPKPDNPRGFHEHLPAVRINDRVLHRLGGSWHDPPPLPPGWQDDTALDDLRTAAADVIANLRSTPSERHLFKDPRLSLTLPFWRTVATIDQAVLVLRPPAPVIRSLLRRDAEREPVWAASLYTTYLLHGLAAAPEAALVDPAAAIGRPQQTISALAAALGHEPTAAELAAASAEVAQDLWSPPPETAPLDVAAVRVAVTLHELVTGDTGPVWRAWLGSVVPRQEVLSAVEDLRAQRDQLRDESDTWHELHDRMRDQRDKAVVEMDRLRGKLQRAREDRGG